MSKEIDCLYLALRKLNKLITDEAVNIFSDLNIHPSYAYILRLVNDREIVKTKDICCSLELDSSTVTRMVDKLINQGYILKGSSNSSTDIYLSDKGSEIISEINKRLDFFENKYDMSKLLTEVNKSINILEEKK